MLCVIVSSQGGRAAGLSIRDLVVRPGSSHW